MLLSWIVDIFAKGRWNQANSRVLTEQQILLNDC